MQRCRLCTAFTKSVRSSYVVAGLTGEQHARLPVAEHDAREDRVHDEVARVLEQLADGPERGEALEQLQRRERERELAAGVGVDGGARRRPAQVDALLAVDARLRACGCADDEEVRVEALLD